LREKLKEKDKTMVKTIVNGAAGRMGSRIIALIQETDGISLSGAIERKGHQAVGKDAGEAAMWGKVGISITDNLSKIIDDSEVVIEFTMPKSTIENLRIASVRKTPFVIGTTGFSNDELEEVKGLTKTIPCVMAPNMSVGVNLVFKTIADIARILGDDYDIEIVEAHHRFKKDAPSGTAIKMAEVIAEALNRNLNEVGIYARHGIIGERKKREIGIQTVRAGDIVGEHTVIFGGMGERIEVTHRAHTRDNFARGAIRAAKWVVKQKPGLYNMMDVLGLK
jgi:4-hydroxy-tetrahydrodipicolinate reductase